MSSRAARGVVFRVGRKSRFLASLGMTFCCLSLGACSARAQPGRRSQRGTVTQAVNGTEISIRYYRPVLRGRTAFPGIVSWGRTWTPGADSATRIETTGALEIEGKTLPPGKYSIWVIPEEKDPWTVIFNHSADAFHMTYEES